ncbi:hypothetical protein ACFW7J_00330, partial [Streptomyces sp. NPDC059525]
MNHPPLPSRPLHGARRQPEEGLGARPATPPPESAAAAREHVRELLLLAGVRSRRQGDQDEAHLVRARSEGDAVVGA